MANRSITVVIAMVMFLAAHGSGVGPSGPCPGQHIHPSYLKWIDRLQDPESRSRACEAAEDLDSSVSTNVVKAAQFFQSLKAEDVLVEALNRNRFDYEVGCLLDYVIDLAEVGDVAVVAAVLKKYRKINASFPCCNIEATLAREELNQEFLKGMAKLVGLDLSGVSVNSEEGRAYVLDLVEHWLRKR